MAIRIFTRDTSNLFHPHQPTVFITLLSHITTPSVEANKQETSIARELPPFPFRLQTFSLNLIFSTN